MGWLKKIGGWIAAAAGLALAWFAVQRVQAKRTAAGKAEQRAKWLEENEFSVENAVSEAAVARAEVLDHSTTAEHIKIKTQQRLQKLEAERGSNRARDMATRLSRL